MAARQVAKAARILGLVDGDRERALEADEGGQDLPPDARQGRFGKLPGVAIDQASDDLGLASGAVGAHGAALG